MKIGHTYTYKDTFELNPPYQRRGGIWTKAQRQLLVDSVLGGFDIPKLYLHENPWHSPDKEYAVADGKQRLLTLWSFMNNEFSISENFTLVDSTNLPNGLPRPGSFYKDLAPAWQDHFAGTSLDFVVITTPNDGKEAERAIREVFTRLNSGAALTAGEKARARAGSLQDLARSISTHDFLTKRVSISTKRGEDMLLAQNLVAMEVEKFRNGSMICERSPERIRTLMLAEDVASGELADSIEETLVNRLTDLCEFFQESDPLLKKRTLIDGYVALIDWAQNRKGGGGVNPADVRAFIADFERRRKLDPSEFDGEAAVYTALVMQGTNSITNLRDRVAILSRWLVKYERGQITK
jgi:hypothetical protein